MIVRKLNSPTAWEHLCKTHNMCDVPNIIIFIQELLATLWIITLELLFPPKIKITTLALVAVQKCIREDGGTLVVVTQT